MANFVNFASLLNSISSCDVNGCGNFYHLAKINLAKINVHAIHKYLASLSDFFLSGKLPAILYGTHCFLTRVWSVHLFELEQLLPSLHCSADDSLITVKSESTHVTAVIATAAKYTDVSTQLLYL